MGKETAKEFISRLKLLQDPDLTDKRTLCEFGKRLKENTYCKIYKQSKLYMESIKRVLPRIK